MAKKFKKIEGDLNIWKPEKSGDQIQGVVLEIREAQFGKQWEIETGDSSIWTPSHRVLQNRLSKVKKGDTVKLVYTGQDLPKVKGNNPTALYDVFVEE